MHRDGWGTRRFYDPSERERPRTFPDLNFMVDIDKLDGVADFYPEVRAPFGDKAGTSLRGASGSRVL